MSSQFLAIMAIIIAISITADDMTKKYEIVTKHPTLRQIKKSGG